MKNSFVFLCLAHIAIFCTGNKLPDLELNIRALLDSPIITYENLADLECAVEEKCLDIKKGRREPQERVILRFDAMAKNIGQGDFKPPTSDRTEWQYHACHKHLHSIATFAKYYLYPRGSNTVAATGMKASFCLEDTVCYGVRPRPRYTCTTEQGIHAGCADIYRKELDCQWIDLTHVKYGVYDLLVSINPDRLIQESSFNNNAVRCRFIYGEDDSELDNCRYVSLP